MIEGLGERLKQRRIALGLSQKNVAEYIGVSPSIISNYESGERTPSVEALVGLSRRYQCSTDYLLGFDKPCMNSLNASMLSKEQQIRLQCFLDGFKK